MAITANVIQTQISVIIGGLNSIIHDLPLAAQKVEVDDFVVQLNTIINEIGQLSISSNNAILGGMILGSSPVILDKVVLQ